MPIFASQDDFKKFEVYKKNVIKASGHVDASGKSFLYFKEYQFSDKKQPMVLIDVHLSVKNELYKAPIKPLASGTVTLTQSNELKFDADKGTLNRAKVKTALGKIGINNVYVASDEVDDENPQGSSQPSERTEEATSVGEAPLNPQMQKKLDFESKAFERRPQQTPPSSSRPQATNPPPTSTVPTTASTGTKPRVMPPLPSTPVTPGTQQPATKVTPPLATPGALKPTPLAPLSAKPAPEPPVGGPPRGTGLAPVPPKVTDTKPATGSNTGSQARPMPPLPPTPPTTTTQPTTPGASGTHPKGMPPLPPTPVSVGTQPTTTTPTAPRSIPLSAYMSATKKLSAAKALADSGMNSLKSAMVAACDPELKQALTDRLSVLDTLLAEMKADEKLLKKIDEGSIENDEDLIRERSIGIANAAVERMKVLSQNDKSYRRLDSNPFGSFAIVEPLRKALDEIRVTFL